ncbi:hypothetical protein [Natronoglycomyces albus]|uniref:Uncharacterized protein n=1 Tax=Natronoglycomyces albus TaxID=2811108 RepID=A0A895Y041_9ACTN|nr:hypothetical protein [Natronoglycomyces albus]QSB07178.1 hypothetical protein JQS30_16880 [Natronoglycomyces albus]
MTTENLGDAFGPTGRSKLGGILPERSPKRQPAPTPVEQAPTETPQDERPTVAPEPDNAQSAAAARQINTFLLPAVKKRAAQRKRANNETNADVAFAAIEAELPRLESLIRARHTGSRTSSLFPSRTSQRSQKRPEGVNREMWTIRATPAEIAVIDDLVESNGALSRSELISVALESYLS